MTVSYGYYLPLDRSLFETVRFLDISPKKEGLGSEEKHKTDKNGVPQWVVSTLVKYQGSKQETEVFTLTAPQAIAETIDMIDELTPIRLVDLAGGKWSRSTTDKTSWSFQISGVEVVK